MVEIQEALAKYEKLIELKKGLLDNIKKSTSLKAYTIFAREVEIERLKIAVQSMKNEKRREGLIEDLEKSLSVNFLENREYTGLEKSLKHLWETRLSILRDCEVK